MLEGTATSQGHQLRTDESFARLERTGQGVLDLIGNTPLLRIERVAAHLANVEILAKAEWCNPGGSVKDRAALRMINAGIAKGDLLPGRTILDATSGNTGIAYAIIGAALGYPVKLFLPYSASQERKRILQAYGAELVMTPGDEGTDGATRRPRTGCRRAEEIFLSDQYSNPAELAGALSRHRGRNLGGDERAHYPFCCSTGNERHVCRNDSAFERIESENSLHQLAARWSVERVGRLEAHADRVAPRHLRRYAGRSEFGDFDRRILRHGEADGARRNH